MSQGSSPGTEKARRRAQGWEKRGESAPREPDFRLKAEKSQGPLRRELILVISDRLDAAEREKGVDRQTKGSGEKGLAAKGSRRTRAEIYDLLRHVGKRGSSEVSKEAKGRAEQQRGINFRIFMEKCPTANKREKGQSVMPYRMAKRRN